MATSHATTSLKIQSALRKAGFVASKRETTRIRGWHRSTQGFKVSLLDGGGFHVEHVNDSQGYGRQQVRAEAEAAYAAALKSAGFSVEIAGGKTCVKPDVE